MTIFWSAFGSPLHPPTPPECCTRKGAHFHPFKNSLCLGLQWGRRGREGGKRTLYHWKGLNTCDLWLWCWEMAYYEAKWLGFNEPWQDSWPWRIWIASRSFHNVLNELVFFLLFSRANIAKGTRAKSRRCLFRTKTRPKRCQPKSKSEINVEGKTVSVIESRTWG